MVIFVDSRLSVVEVGRRDPLGVAAGVFAGGPAARFDQWVVGSAGQGQLVDVCTVGGGPVLDVVDLAPVRGCVAAGARAAAVLGMKPQVVHIRLSCGFRGRTACLVSRPCVCRGDLQPESARRTHSKSRNTQCTGHLEGMLSVWTSTAAVSLCSTSSMPARPTGQ